MIFIANSSPVWAAPEIDESSLLNTNSCMLRVSLRGTADTSLIFILGRLGHVLGLLAPKLLSRLLRGSHRLELPCCGEGGPFDLREQSAQSWMPALTQVIKIAQRGSARHPSSRQQTGIWTQNLQQVLVCKHGRICFLCIAWKIVGHLPLCH